MDYVIHPLSAEDKPILWEMLYQGLSSPEKQQQFSREIVHQPEFARYVEGWGRTGDTGFVAVDKKDGSLLGAVWLRAPIDKPHSPQQLAFAVKPEHRRHGIGTSLLTQLVRATPEHSAISISLVGGRPKRLSGLYERFGFKILEERPDGIVMQRQL